MPPAVPLGINPYQQDAWAAHFFDDDVEGGEGDALAFFWQVGEFVEDEACDGVGTAFFDIDAEGAFEREDGQAAFADQ